MVEFGVSRVGLMRFRVGRMVLLKFGVEFFWGCGRNEVLIENCSFDGV